MICSDRLCRRSTYFYLSYLDNIVSLTQILVNYDRIHTCRGTEESVREIKVDAFMTWEEFGISDIQMCFYKFTINLINFCDFFHEQAHGITTIFTKKNKNIEE